MEWTLELILAVLLMATLFQAIRLERALGVLKRDRASLEALVNGFRTSTTQAETGIQHLRSAIDGAGRQIEAQLAKSNALKTELALLTERGERIAGRLNQQVAASRHREPIADDDAEAKPPSLGRAERDLLAALRMAR